MNMGMLKQVQKLQKDMMNTKEEIDNTIFEGKSSFVTVKINGKKEVLSIKIEQNSIENDEIELVQDMLVVALNDAMKKVDKELEQKMGKFTQGMPGLF